MIRIILLCLGIMALLMLLSARIQSNTIWWKEQRNENETNNEGQNYLVRKSRTTGNIFDDELMRIQSDLSLNNIRRNDLSKQSVLPEANNNWSECKKCVVGAYQTADWSTLVGAYKTSDWTDFKKIPDIKGACKSKCKMTEDNNPEVKPKEVVKPKKCWYQFYKNGNCDKK